MPPAMPSTPPTPPAPPRPPWPRHWRLALVLGTSALLVGGAWQLALLRLQGAVQQMLGPRSSVDSLSLGLAAVELQGLRLRGDRNAGWPADDEARARRVRIVPDWRSLFDGLRGGPLRLHELQVEGGYIALLRQADGQLQLLPGLQPPDRPPARGAAAPGTTAPTPLVQITRLRLSDATVELFDASVRRPPHRLQLVGLQAEAGPLAFPPAPQPTRLSVQGRLKGPQHDGTLALNGQVAFSTREATLTLRLQGVDLLTLQPYLLKAGEGSVRGGQLDLALDPTVHAQRLHAPGTLTLRGLTLDGGNSLAGWLAGVPRQAVLATLKRDGRITLKFTLDGRLDDPAFSINENLARRVAGGLAEAVGVSLSGMVDGVGGLIKGLLGR